MIQTYVHMITSATAVVCIYFTYTGCKICIRSVGLNLKTAHWLDILFYGSLVWWTALEKEILQKVLDKFQWFASMLISECPQTTSSNAHEIILFLPSDLFGEKTSDNLQTGLVSLKIPCRQDYDQSLVKPKFFYTGVVREVGGLWDLF